MNSMDNFFDNLSRQLAACQTRRGAVFTILASLGFLTLTGCPDSITGSKPAGCASGKKDCGGFCCSSTTAFCFTAGVCCSVNLPHYCANTKLCYQTTGLAYAAGGSSVEACASRSDQRCNTR
mgnify:CR=1 FL=1